MIPTSDLRYRAIVPLIAVAVLFTGCLTIEEHYTFKRDGSGSMEYVVDISEMMNLFKGLEGLAGKEGKDKDGSDDDADLTQHVDELKKIPGIKGVKVKKEEDGARQRLRFKFKDLAALNRAMNQLMPDSTGVPTEFFRWDGSTLVRANNLHAQDIGQEMGSGNEPDSSDATMILQSMKYRYSFTFADAIGSVEKADAVAQELPTPKQVKLDTDWSVIMSDPKALDLRITLQR